MCQGSAGLLGACSELTCTSSPCNPAPILPSPQDEARSKIKMRLYPLPSPSSPFCPPPRMRPVPSLPLLRGI